MDGSSKGTRSLVSLVYGNGRVGHVPAYYLKRNFCFRKLMRRQTTHGESLKVFVFFAEKYLRS